MGATAKKQPQMSKPKPVEVTPEEKRVIDGGSEKPAKPRMIQVPVYLDERTVERLDKALHLGQEDFRPRAAWLRRVVLAALEEEGV